jgi:predicted transcriptional regulator
MAVHSTSFRTDHETLSALDEIAQEMGRSRNWVLNKAVQDFIKHQAWFKKQVDEGIKAADNGEFASDEEMAAVFRRFGA